MALWKIIKKNRKEKTKKTKKAPLPKSVMIWIDAAYSDQPARVIRGLALAEAFCKADIESVSLSCLACGGLTDEITKRNIQWINSRPDGNPLTFNEIVKVSAADIVIADCTTPPRLQPDLNTSLFALLADAYSDSLFASNRVDAALLPGLITQPDFENIEAQASCMADCIHGLQYVPILDEYFSQNNETPSEDRLLIAVSGNASPEDLSPILDAVRPLTRSPIKILADVSTNSADQLKEAFSSDAELLISPSLSDRITAIRQTCLVIARPGLNIYELIAMGKPVILTPRTDKEIKTCQLFLKQNAVRVTPIADSFDMLKMSIEELLKNGEERKKLSQQAVDLLDANGSKNTVDILLTRFARIELLSEIE